MSLDLRLIDQLYLPHALRETQVTRARQRRRTFNRATFTRPGTPENNENRTWYRIDNNAGSGAALIYLYDEIGMYGISAGGFLAELSELRVSAIELHINSPGGEVFDGVAIMNALRSHAAHVTTHVDGIAASIASVIAMAGDTIVMAPHSQMMIHEASGIAVGPASLMRDMADLLDKQSDNIASVYASRAGGRTDSWRKKMRDETWYSAKEAVEAGLADEVAKQTRQTDKPKAELKLQGTRYENRDAAPAPDLTVDEPEPSAEKAPELEAATATVQINLDDAMVTEAVMDMLREAVRVRGAAVEAALEADPVEPAEPAEPDGQVATLTVEPEAPAEPEQPAEAAIEATEPDLDPWAAAVAHLTTVPDPDAEFARLTEALK